MNELMKTLGNMGIIPVFTVNDAEDAVPICKALTAGGLPAAEIMFRSSEAEKAIRKVAVELPDVLVGAGTVLTVEQAKRALDAGAKFIVSPGFDRSLVEFCINKNVPVLPGCSTPSEIQTAVGYGLDTIKYFPVIPLGGVETLKQLSGPYSTVNFVVTGGVDSGNLAKLLSFNKVLAVGGNWMVIDDAVKSKNFKEITRIVRDDVNTMLGFELAHIGINAGKEENALKIAETMAAILNMPMKPGEKSHFVGSAVEVLKSEGLGHNGHIGIKTSSVKRTIYHLEQKGIEFNNKTINISPEGIVNNIYLKEEIGGFAIHFFQN